MCCDFNDLSAQPIDEICLFSVMNERTNFASLTKIERQEIISVSIEYSIIFLAVFVDKLENLESCMLKCLVH